MDDFDERYEVTHIWRMFTYVGDRSIYGTKLVSMCHGSNDRTLETAYTA